MHEYLLSLIFGTVEGLTEFVPVSSTAHLRIAEALLKVDLEDGFWKMYTIVIQLGAILSLPIFFRRKLLRFVRSFPRGETGDRTALTHPLGLTLLACAVTVVPAYLLHKTIGRNLESLAVIGLSLCVGGVVMWAVDVLCARPRVLHVDGMSLGQAVWIGAAQVLSTLFPGTSRSMSTIAAGQASGMSRSAAIEFSFLLSIPTMVAATGYEFLREVVLRRPAVGESLPPVQMNAHRWAVLAIGFAASFAVGWAVVAWFVGWVSRRGLAPFAIYRILLGVGVLGWAMSLHPRGPVGGGLPASRGPDRTVAAPGGAYDVLREAYAPYMDARDPLGFPMKVRAVAANRYKFWRGTKDVFARWCKANAADWLDDRGAYMPIHGDLHLGNIGAYPTGPDPAPMAVGLIDFDDSVRLPFQFELLQGLITLQVAARQNHVALTPARQDEFCRTFFETYRKAVSDHRRAFDLIAADKDLTRLFGRNRPYEHELLKYTDGAGHFRRSTTNGERVTNVLRPVPLPPAAFADAVAEALRNAPGMRDAFRTADRAELALAIRDVALRTRVGSCGSQGLTKYLVLLDRPLRGVDHDLILYLKREIPTAAERTGLVATDPRPQGQRCAEDTAALTDPRPAFVSWCHIGQDSYWVTSRDPRTDELDPDAVRDFKSLLRAARVWATVAGAAHGRAGRDRLIVPRLSADLLASLRWRADAYLQKVERGFADFQADPRVAANVAAAEAALAEAAIGNR